VPENAPSDDLITLDPRHVRLSRSDVTGDVSVRATIDDPAVGAARSWQQIKIARAFPLSKPDQFIGLRDVHDKDIGILLSLDGLDRQSRQIVDEELQRRYFVPIIRRVIDVKEEGSMTTWQVETDRGPQTFVVQNLRDAVYEVVPERRILLTDIRGVRYDIPEVTTLEPKVYAILSRFL